MLEESLFKNFNLHRTTNLSNSYPLLKRFYLGSIDVVFAVAKCFDYEYNVVERIPAIY